MAWLRRLTDRLANWRVIAVLALPTLTLFGIFNFHPAAVPYLVRAGKGMQPLDIQIGYGPRDVQSLFTNYDVDGRQRYRVFLIVDTIFAVCYGLMLTGLLRLLLRPLVASAVSRLNDLPLLCLFAGAADCLENSCILVLLGIYPATAPVLVYSASVATMVKWSLAAVSIVAILVTAGVRLTRSRGSTTDANGYVATNSRDL
jgi:hypothetical protein